MFCWAIGYSLRVSCRSSLLRTKRLEYPSDLKQRKEKRLPLVMRKKWACAAKKFNLWQVIITFVKLKQSIWRVNEQKTVFLLESCRVICGFSLSIQNVLPLWPIDYDNDGKYPLTTSLAAAAAAKQETIAGKAEIISINNGKNKTALSHAQKERSVSLWNPCVLIDWPGLREGETFRNEYSMRVSLMTEPFLRVMVHAGVSTWHQLCAYSLLRWPASWFRQRRCPLWV